MINEYLYVKETLSKAELLAQLAEEATELGHAALKYRRAIDGTNPTPVTKQEALSALKEEIADVINLIGFLELDGDHMMLEYVETGIKKTVRWANRLKEKHGEQ